MKNRDDDNTCIEIENSLPLYVGGDLEDADATEVARHLSACATCAQSERAAREARDLLVSALKLSQRKGPELWTGVRGALADQGLLERRVPEPSRTSPMASSTDQTRRAPTGRRMWGYGAAAAAAVLVGFWLGGDALDTQVPYAGVVDRPADPSVVVDAGRAPIVPVANPDGLRLVGRGEGRLRDGADIYYPDGRWLEGPTIVDPNVGTPVGLTRVRRP